MLSFILCLFLWVAFGLAVLRYAAFFLSNRRAGELATIRREAGPLFLPIVRGLVTSVMADATALTCSLFLLLPEDDSPWPGDPVVMVHGLYHNRTAWRIMRRRLKKAGFANLHTYQYDSFTRDFEPAVHGLLRKLDLVLAGRPEARVILIGHSLGGLVSRCAAGNPQYRDRIKALVTLGSPHKGSDLAWLGPNRMARDLLPGGHIARSVDRMPDPDCPRLSIRTLTDDYVFPLSMLRPSRPGWEEAICPPMAHVWMLYSRNISKTVIAFLKEKVGA